MSLEPGLIFDAVAAAYERSRPGYAPDAVAWIAERLPLRRVLDLGAGTGKLTRQLVPYADEVVAVEPAEGMRRMLQAVVFGVEVHAGTAEAIPLPEASVDTVTVAQAFHWFDIEAALAEMHRVIRPGGGYAIVWNEWDETDALLKAIKDLISPLRPPYRAVADDDACARVLSSPLFANADERSFPNVGRISPDLVVEQVSSISTVVAASADDRARVLAAIRRLCGSDDIDFHNVTRVIAADRV